MCFYPQYSKFQVLMSKIKLISFLLQVYEGYMWATIIFLCANIKRGFYHFGDSCSVLKKISGASIRGINVSDEYFLVRELVVFGDVFLSPKPHCSISVSSIGFKPNHFHCIFAWFVNYVVSNISISRR